VIRFVCVVLAVLAPLALVLALTPVAADGWELVLRHKDGPPGWAGVVEYARYAHFHHNPRVGEIFDYVAHGGTLIHVLMTEVVVAATLLAMFVLAHGAWPRPGEPRDLWRLVVLIGLFAVGTPAIGQMLAYRPFTTNYVYGFALCLWLAVPYRLGFGGASAALWMLPLGLLAGLSNEHTGPAVLLALSAATVVKWRWHPGALAGLGGLVIGMILLLAAPGQAERYHGLATQSSLLGALVANSWRIGLFLLCCAATLLALALTRRRPPRLALGFFLVALAIVVTSLASPKQGLRLYYAPAVLLSIGAAMTLDGVGRGRQVIAAVAALAWIIVAAKMIVVYQRAGAEASARRQLLARAAPGSVAVVPPYSQFSPSWFVIGDDFRAAHVRERVARQLFGLQNALLDVRQPAQLAATGVSLAFASEPARTPADVVSGQIYTPAELSRTLDQFRAAVEQTRVERAQLRVLAPERLGFARPLVLASWQTGAFRLPVSVRPGQELPRATHVLRVGDECRPASPRFEPWGPGAYLAISCAPDSCYVVATSDVRAGLGPAFGW
jgi:Family of unknown function (DUF6056)